MDPELIQLLRFADEAISRYITFYLSAAGALTVLVMQRNYQENFSITGKVVLTVCLAALAWNNWVNMVYYQTIYNSTVDAIQGMQSGINNALMLQLAGENGALQHKPLWYVHVGHLMGNIAMGSMVWSIEIKAWAKAKLLPRWNEWRATRTS